ncbi:MAG TPA: PfkB family carbohydrate kinase [Solirubrobacterales bacterium]|nr:PfkB family carbohydrate kinase [Solirubrobacterales bacterium]
MADEGKSPRSALDACSVAVFAPSPVLTVTIEDAPGDPEIHLHAGGQGFWVARMAARLGAEVILCAPLGGEAGDVLHSLLTVNGINLLSVRMEGANGAYVHDRRDGARQEIARTPSPPLARHELDDLCGVTLTAGLESDVVLVTGPRDERVLPAQVYQRLCRDLRANGRPVLADLSGEPLTEALKGGVDLLKVSDEELVADGRLARREKGPTVEAARVLHDEGASNVLISRGAEPALVLAGDRLLEVDGPHFTPVDERGAGDSMFAATGIGVGAGLPIEGAVKLGVAAGALNVARRGLGTGRLRNVSSLAEQVRVAPLSGSETG